MRGFSVRLLVGFGLLSAVSLHGEQVRAAEPPVTVTPEETDEILANPGMGWQTFHRTRTQDNNLPSWIPSTVHYARWGWGTLEPDEGKIDYDFLDGVLSDTREAGQKLAFRVMCCSTYPRHPYHPQWLRDMRGGVVMTRYGDGPQLEIPVLDESVVLKSHLDFINRLGARYDGHPDIDHRIPEITTWFYGPRDADKFVFERGLTLENPTHVPDFAKFKATYDRVGHDKKCLTLQGHPNSWDDERWDAFVKIIDYLKSKACVFTTPSEYLERMSHATPTSEASGQEKPLSPEFARTSRVNKNNVVTIGRNQIKTSMKGWELCIWQQDGDTYFSLMVGTNRLKNEREIAQTAVKGLDAIKLKLAELKAGQHVFLGGRRSTDRAPDDQSKVVAEYCTKIGLKVRR